MDEGMYEEEKKSKGYDEWDCKRFAEVLLEAEAIKGDKKKMAAAEKHMSKMKKDIASLADLKAVAKEKLEADDEAEA